MPKYVSCSLPSQLESSQDPSPLGGNDNYDIGRISRRLPLHDCRAASTWASTATGLVLCTAVRYNGFIKKQKEPT